MEVKQIYCPIIFEEIKSDNPWIIDAEPGHFIIKNRNLVLDTKPYKVTYAVRENGHVVKTGLFELPYLKAGEDTKASFLFDYGKEAECGIPCGILCSICKGHCFRTGWL